MRARGEHSARLKRLVAILVCSFGFTFGAERAGAATLEGAPPVDAPRSVGKPLELPPVPRGFNKTPDGFIDFSYPPGVGGRMRPLERDAAAIRAEFAMRLGQPVLDAVHVRIARTPGEMTTLAPEGAPYPRYASGVAYSDIELVLLSVTPPQANASQDLEEVFRHELAHLALQDAIGAGHRVPRWFNEGLAVHLSRESSLLRIRTLSTATLAGRLIPLEELNRGFPSDAAAADLAYAEAADVVRFLLRQEDSDRFPALIARLRAGESFEPALHDAYGLDLPALEYEWREDVAKRYSFWPVFFSGTLIWGGVLVLLALGYRRRRRQSRATLELWAREEAYAELRARENALAPTAARVHIVLPGHEPTPEPSETSDLPALPPAALDADVPKIQHDGRWHTLH